MNRATLVMLAIVGSGLFASLAPGTALAQAALSPAEGGCEIVVQFFNMGTPMLPGEGADRRYGVRLNVEGTVYAILPADQTGTVRFYGAVDRPVPFRAVPLYMPYSYTQADYSTPGMSLGTHLASCGINRVQTSAGT